MAVNRGRPAQQAIRRTEDHHHYTVARIAWLNSCSDADPSRAAWQQGRRHRRETVDTRRSQRSRLGAAPRVGVEATGENVQGKIHSRRRLAANLDRPHLTTDRLEVRRIVDVLVPQELGPRTVGRVGEVVRRPLALAVPAAGRLRRVLPQKRIARVDLAEGNHVADIVTSSRASSRTRAGPASSGSHSPVSSCAGARPLSTLRFRPNHRRMPMSL